MAYWRETEDADQRATRRPGMWARLTPTILTLVGVASFGLMTWTIRGGLAMSDVHAALTALLVYVTVCLLIIGVDHAINGQERAAEATQPRTAKRWPYNVVAEAEAVLARAQEPETP